MATAERVELTCENQSTVTLTHVVLACSALVLLWIVSLQMSPERIDLVAISRGGPLSDSTVMELRVDQNWVLVSAALVFFMQAGFCCYEAGRVRSKNSIDVGVMNLVDFCLAALLFWLCGFTLMLGSSGPAPWGESVGSISGSLQFFGFTEEARRYAGSSYTEALKHWQAVVFVFQLGYCAICITIVSGAVAERMRLAPYLLLAVAMGCFIYPLFGNWAWGGLADRLPTETPVYTGWLGRLGFRDFAGSTVVHSLGAWVALAAIWMIGPRAGRYDSSDGQFKSGHNLPLSTLGLMILWLGWFGFSGGRTFAENSEHPAVMINTVLAGACGGLAGLILDVVWRWAAPRLPWFRDRPHLHHAGWNEVPPEEIERATDSQSTFRFSVYSVLNGTLAGLVASCASCHLATQLQMACIAFTAAMGMYICLIVMNCWRLDDVVGAVASHGVGGAIGTIAVGVIASDEHSVWVQLLGVVTCFLWAVGCTLFVLAFVRAVSAMLRRFVPGQIWKQLGQSLQLNLTESEQETGSNVWHGVMAELDEVLYALESIVSPSSETGRIPQWGTLRQKLRSLLDSSIEEEAKAVARGNELRNMSHELRTPVSLALLAIGRAKEKAGQEDLDGLHREMDRVQQALTTLKLMVEESCRQAELHEPIRPAQLSVRQLLKSIHEQFSPSAESVGVKLHWHCHPSTPRSICSDEAKLKKILINLVSNAVKYVPAGEEIKLESQLTRDGMLELTVSDTGPGVPEEVLEQFGERDIRGAQHERSNVPGSGIGINISVRQAELLGGTLSAQNDRLGAIFTVRIPTSNETSPWEGSSTLEHDSAATRPVEALASDSVSIRSERGNDSIAGESRVAIVEDDEGLLCEYVEILTEAGHEVLAARDEAAALRMLGHELMAGRAIDLVLTDLNLRNDHGERDENGDRANRVFGGHRIARQLRAMGFRGRIIGMTASVTEDRRGYCRQAGMDDLFTKDELNLDELRSLAKRTLDESDVCHEVCRVCYSAAVGKSREKIVDAYESLLERYQQVWGGKDEQSYETMRQAVHSMLNHAFHAGFWQLRQTLIDLENLCIVLSESASEDADTIEDELKIDRMALIESLERLGDYLKRIVPEVAPSYVDFCGGVRAR